MKQRLLNIAIAIDQLAYVLITLGAGCPDETLSAAAWRTEKSGKFFGAVFRPIIDFLWIPIERNHCHTAFMSEVQRKHLPQEYKNTDTH